MEYKDLISRIGQAISSMEEQELQNLYAAMESKGFFADKIDNEDTDKIRVAIKETLHQVSAEEFREIAPASIIRIIDEMETKTVVEDEIEDVEKKPPGQEETKESLVQEAIKIISQKDGEVAKDLQPRLAYIITKLNLKFQLSQREISRLINLNRSAVASRIEKYTSEQPDLIKMWVQSVENKVFSKTEETIAKQASSRAIATLRDNITIGDAVREKWAAAAGARGYNLYSSSDLEKIINQGVGLFFEIDGIHEKIMVIERENEILRNQNLQLKKTNWELHKQILVLID